MYKKGYSDQHLIDVTTSLFKYQNFKGESMVKKVPSNYYKGTSLKAMSAIMRNYLRTGDRSNKRVQPLFYDTLDKCVANHVQPLVPSANDKAGVYKGRKNTAKAVVTKAAKHVTKPINTSYKLALQVDDMIKICPNQSYMDGYMDAFKQMEKQLGQTLNFKQIKISIVD